MFSGLARLFGGSDIGPTIDEHNDLYTRSRLSDFINLFVYDDQANTYHNSDGTIGWIWECSPLILANEKTLDTAEGLLRIALPEYSVLTFTVHADPYINDIIDRYKEKRKNCTHPLLLRSMDYQLAFMKQCTKGLRQLSGIPLRNYRLFVSLKFKDEGDIDTHEVKTTVAELLKGMMLSPVEMKPPALLSWLRRLMNDDVSNTKDVNGNPISEAYSEHAYINKQIIHTETEISKSEKPYLKIGSKYWRSMTPKTYAEIVDPLKIKGLFGGIWGVNSDNDQYRTPFLYSFNIIYRKLRPAIETKATVVLNQRGAGTFATRLGKAQTELRVATDKLNEGEPFAEIIPIMWFIGDSKEAVDESYSRGKKIWETNGFYMQNDQHIIWPMFLSSLPMGLRATKESISLMSREIIVDATAILNMLPLQTDFCGAKYDPVILYQGRTGQIIPISMFTSMANNFNGFCCAPPGSGKSVQGNHIAFNTYSAGGLVRIIDIGDSYKRQCKMLDGRYLDFDLDNPLCLNPFTTINGGDVEELSADISATASILLQMVYSASEEPDVSEIENTLAADAVTYAWELKGVDATMDDARAFLQAYPDLGTNGKRATEEINIEAHHMAFNMAEFTTGGRYSKYFIGAANFDINKDKFVVLELGKLTGNPSLFKVVIMLVLTAVTRNLYYSDRNIPKMILVDEAWQFLGKSNANKMMAKVVEGAYRKARKHLGGVTILTQGLMDILDFGPIGNIVWGYSDFKILLQSSDFEKAKAAGIIDYDEMTMRQLKSVSRNGTNYSEAYFSTPYGAGVVRLALDPFSYYMYTSSGPEVAEMESMVKGGMTYVEAIDEMVRKYRSSEFIAC